MSLISNVAGIAANLLRIGAGWFDKYASKENQVAREMSEEKKKIDELHKHLKDRNLDAVRRDLSQ